MIKLLLWPEFNTPDDGDGGIRRVWTAQIKHLPKYGVEIVADPIAADVIACHISIPDEYLRRFPSKAFVVHHHGSYGAEYVQPDGSSQWPNWCLQANGDVIRAILAADIVTSPSEWVTNTVRRNTCRDVRTVPHGVDLEDWPMQKPVGLNYVVWNKTRIDPNCDPDPITKLARLMPQTNFISTFMGPGEQPSNLKLTGRMPYEQGKRLVQDASIYLCTTRETFGIGTLEAMACGIPIVGYRWGAQREFIEHGVDGWLAAPDDIEGLAEGVRWAQKNRAAAGAAARAKAEQFTWDRPAQMYADIYEEAVAKRAPYQR